MRIVWVSVILVVLDQITKLLVKGVNIAVFGLQWEGVPLGSSRPVFGDFVRLTFIENPGMAFGIDIGGKLFFSLFTLLASIGIVIYLYKMRSEPLLMRLSLAAILGGACGNLIDRIFYSVFYGEGPLFYGKVVDFIDVDFFDLTIFGYSISRWPVFNVADASVTIGVVLLLFAHRSTVPSPASIPIPTNEEGVAVPRSPERHPLEEEGVERSEKDSAPGSSPTQSQ